MIILTFILFLCSSIGPIALGESGMCDDMEITIDVEKQSNTVIVNVDSGHEPYQYLFYDKSQKLLNRNNTTLNTNKFLKPGRYYCAVIDNSGCMKKVEFDINI